jgi:allantoinase
MSNMVLVKLKLSWQPLAMRLKIVNGTLVMPTGSQRGDVRCRDGLIEQVGNVDASAADEQIDASGWLVFPGFIDPHVHSRDPGLTHKEDFAHSTRAAAAGGVTTLLEMPNAIPPVTDASIFEDRAVQHARVASVDFGLWGLALGPDNLADIEPLFAAGAVGVKLFWGYALDRNTRTLVYNLGDAAPEDLIQPPGNGEVLELCHEVARVGGLLGAHCEDRGVIEAAERGLGRPIASYADVLAARPDTAEAVAIAIAAELSATTDCRFHVVHTSSGRGIRAVRRAQAEGIKLSAETCPHYLALTNADFERIGESMKVYPPIRTSSDQAQLWAALQDGTVTSLGSDHAPHTVEEKSRGLASAPAGVSGVQTLGAVLIDAMLAGRLSRERLAWLLSEGTARLYGLFTRKGTLQPGADADFTLVDPNGVTLVDAERLYSKQPQSPWQGQRLRGAVKLTVLRGEVIARDGEPVGQPRGRLVRARHSAAVANVDEPLAFTRELDAHITPETMPATVFNASE